MILWQKLLTGTVLAAALLLAGFIPTATLAAAPSAGVFNDVKDGDWFAPAVLELYQQGVIDGYGDGGFHPRDTVTRAEFVKLLAVMVGASKAEYENHSVFPDAGAGRWFAPYVAWAADKGIVGGYRDGLFHPSDQIDRQEMMVMLCRCYSYCHQGAALPVLASEVEFSDGALISGWAADSVRALQMAGVINGQKQYRVAPRDVASRAEAAQMLTNYGSLDDYDRSREIITGLLLAAEETVYWQDGRRCQVGSPTMMGGEEPLVSLALYGEYHHCDIWALTDGQCLGLPDGERWLAFRAGELTLELNDGTTLPLPVAPQWQGDDLLVPLSALAPRLGDSWQYADEAQALLIYPQTSVVDSQRWLAGYEAWRSTGGGASVTVSTRSYGVSGLGRTLNCTEIAPAGFTRTVLLVFEQHGFEDEYDRDGAVLVAAAERLIDAFRTADAASLHDTRLVVVASANPDGLYDGVTNNGPGRCTVVGATDMNRNWPTSNYFNRSNSRNYTAAPLSVAETQSLYQLINELQPSVLLDIHGWLNGVYGDSGLAAIFHRELGLPYQTLFSGEAGLSSTDVSHLSATELAEAHEAGLVNFAGYLHGYGYEQGIRSALVELKSPYYPDTAGLIRAVQAILAES